MTGRTIELTPTPGLPPSVVDALMDEMRDQARTLVALERRATRTETRLVKLLGHFGLDAQGDSLNPEESW